IGAAFRLIPYEIKGIEELGLPPVVADLARYPRGFVVVTGPTGSGKSTTLAAMVDIVNRERSAHIMTIEDPIEFLHRHVKCIVNQREVGADTHSFSEALRHVLRQDPDVILVGEMRDLETIGTAITAAETGHLVFATLHTQDAPQTIDRIIDVFPPHQQQQVRVQLATTLQGVVTQQLLQTADGRGRVVAAEILVCTPAVRNLIREGKVHQIYSIMQAAGRWSRLRWAGRPPAWASAAGPGAKGGRDRRCHRPTSTEFETAAGTSSPASSSATARAWSSPSSARWGSCRSRSSARTPASRWRSTCGPGTSSSRTWRCSRGSSRRWSTPACRSCAPWRSWPSRARARSCRRS